MGLMSLIYNAFIKNYEYPNLKFYIVRQKIFVQFCILNMKMLVAYYKLLNLTP